MTDERMKHICENGYVVENIPMDAIVIYNGIEDRFELTEIDELSANIKEKGMHTEVWVRTLESGAKELFAGRRRYEAHKLLEKETIRAKIFAGLRDIDIPYLRFAENRHRKDYNALEKILYVIQLIDMEAKKAGMDNTIVKNNTTRITILAAAIAQHRKSGKKVDDMSGDKLVAIAIKVLKRTGAFASIFALERAIPIVQLPLSARKLMSDGRLAIKPAAILAKGFKKQKLDTKTCEEIIKNLDEKGSVLTEKDVLVAINIRISNEEEVELNTKDVFSKLKIVFNDELAIDLKPKDKQMLLKLARNAEKILSSYKESA